MQNRNARGNLNARVFFLVNAAEKWDRESGKKKKEASGKDINYKSATFS